MVQIDGAGRGGLVDPGVACWVGISGELGAREERGMSAWQFAVMKLARASASIEAFSGAGRGGLVDPGVACWVGISGALGASEERGMSAWQFA